MLDHFTKLYREIEETARRYASEAEWAKDRMRSAAVVHDFIEAYGQGERHDRYLACSEQLKIILQRYPEPVREMADNVVSQTTEA